ncbi:WG repeat-containing protein, partial [Psychrobacter sp. AOP42-A1-21]
MKLRINLYKLLLVSTLVSCTLFAQSISACVRPHVAGYHDISCLKDGLAKVLRNDKYGFINANKEIVVAPTYSSIGYFSEGNAWVSSSDYKYGFINKMGKLVIPLIFDQAGDFSEGLAVVKVNDKTGFISRSGDVVISLQYDNAGDFSEGLAWMKQDDKYGYIDRSGKAVIEPQYEDA